MHRGVVTTQVKNISGHRRYFGWLPPHGRHLEINQVYEVVGILATHLAVITNKTYFKSYEDDLNDHRVEVWTTGTALESLDKAIHDPVADITGLQAIIATTTPEPYIDKMIILVEDSGLYRYEEGSTLLPDGSDVVIPDDIAHPDPGRWIRLTAGGTPASSSSAAPGEEPIFTTKELTTNDNAIHDIDTVLIPDDTLIIFTAYFMARRTDSSDHAGYVRRAVVFRAGGGGALKQGPTQTLLTRESSSPWNALISVSGNNALLQVKGNTGHTVDWKVQYYMTTVS